MSAKRMKRDTRNTLDYHAGFILIDTEQQNGNTTQTAQPSSKKHQLAQHTVQHYDAQIEQRIAHHVDAVCDAATAVIRSQLTQQLNTAVQSRSFSEMKADHAQYGVGSAVKQCIKQYLRTDKKFSTTIADVARFTEVRDNVQRQQQLNAYVEPVQTFADAQLIRVCMYISFNDMIALRQVDKQWRSICQQREAWKYIVLDLQELMNGRKLTMTGARSRQYYRHYRKLHMQQFLAYFLTLPALCLQQLQRIVISGMLDLPQQAKAVLQHLYTVAPNVCDIHLASSRMTSEHTVLFVHALQWSAVTRCTAAVQQLLHVC